MRHALNDLDDPVRILPWIIICTKPDQPVWRTIMRSENIFVGPADNGCYAFRSQSLRNKLVTMCRAHRDRMSGLVERKNELSIRNAFSWMGIVGEGLAMPERRM